MSVSVKYVLFRNGILIVVAGAWLAACRPDTSPLPGNGSGYGFQSVLRSTDPVFRSSGSASSVSSGILLADLTSQTWGGNNSEYLCESGQKVGLAFQNLGYADGTLCQFSAINPAKLDGKVHYLDLTGSSSGQSCNASGCAGTTSTSAPGNYERLKVVGTTSGGVMQSLEAHFCVKEPAGPDGQMSAPFQAYYVKYVLNDPAYGGQTSLVEVQAQPIQAPPNFQQNQPQSVQYSSTTVGTTNGTVPPQWQDSKEIDAVVLLPWFALQIHINQQPDQLLATSYFWGNGLPPSGSTPTASQQLVSAMAFSGRSVADYMIGDGAARSTYLQTPPPPPPVPGFNYTPPPPVVGFAGWLGLAPASPPQNFPETEPYYNSIVNYPSYVSQMQAPTVGYAGDQVWNCEDTDDGQKFELTTPDAVFGGSGVDCSSYFALDQKPFDTMGCGTSD